MNEYDKGLTQNNGMNNMFNVNSENCFSSNQPSMKKHVLNPFAPESSNNFSN
jgi:hypothetical protein